MFISYWFLKREREKLFYFLFEPAKPPNNAKIASIKPATGDPVFCISIVLPALTNGFLDYVNFLS